MLILYLFLLLLTPEISKALPTMLTKGYRSCTTCHVSPTGGGILTPYGQGSARDILPYSNSNLQVPSPDWLLLGGNLRLAQLRAATDKYAVRKLTVMQADLEVAIGTESIKAVGTLGYDNPTSSGYSGSDIFSRRHYVLFSPRPGIQILSGRTFIPYGPTFNDHYLLQKTALGFGEGTERYQIQASYIAENQEITAYYTKEKSGGFRALTALSPTSYIGLNTYFSGPRLIAGPELAVTITTSLIAICNLDFDFHRVEAEFLRTLRLDYEVSQGVHFFGIHESMGNVLAHVLGITLFPIQHLELQGAIRFSTFQTAWLVLHVYL